MNFVSNIATNIQLIEKNNVRATNRRKMLENLNSLFQLIEIQIVIFKKKIRNIFEKFYEKSQKSMKSLIKKFQVNDKIVKKFVEKNKKSFRRRRNKFYWKMNSKDFFKFKNRLYVFENATIKKKFISKHHDDFLTKHFDVDKIVNLIQRKFYWFVCAKQIRSYVKICDICQRIKIHRYKFFEKFKSLSISNTFWKKIIMNFIIDLLFNKRRDIVYDSIFVIMNRCIKMIKYIFVTIKIDVVTLTKIFLWENSFSFWYVNKNNEWQRFCFH